MPLRPVTSPGTSCTWPDAGSGSEDGRLVPCLGYPTLVRGFDSIVVHIRRMLADSGGSCPEFDRPVGSRVLVLNEEVRAGLRTFKAGTNGAVPVDILAFVDSGVAWTDATATFAGGDPPGRSAPASPDSTCSDVGEFDPSESNSRCAERAAGSGAGVSAMLLAYVMKY
jgi:hypothetical protein